MLLAVQAAAIATASSAVYHSTTGSPCSYTRRSRETVTAVSQRLADHGGLRGLFRLDVAELARVAVWAMPSRPRQAALELGRRLAALSPEERPRSARRRTWPICSASRWRRWSRSRLRVVLLDTQAPHPRARAPSIRQRQPEAVVNWVPRRCSSCNYQLCSVQIEIAILSVGVNCVRQRCHSPATGFALVSELSHSLDAGNRLALHCI